MLQNPEQVVHSLELQANRKYLIQDGILVCWRGFGKGEPLVLIHGGHGSWLHWVMNIETLAQHRTVWVPDLPGFGDSEAPKDPASMDLLLDALQGTLAQLLGADTPVDVVGFSFGGVVAAQLAARHRPTRKLALLGATGHGGRRREREPLVNWRRSRQEPVAMLADLRQNLEVLMLSRPADPLALEVHRHSCVMTRFRSKGVSQTQGVLSRALDRFGGPVDMLWGDLDATGIAAEVGPLLKDGHPERTWRTVHGAGHWVQYEAPQQVNAFLVNWLSTSTGAPEKETQ
ncbi:MAG: alpha/beta fold hydrolase [Hydrogenophaga sp.]|uniref:alpha/beta fold hydrolase n=1 Tax=Hydrogenophaga sp. TaxID=1904254 RepID=UPI00271E5949|nr:alpha/beta fold hydrolase [Hydrogenophaga sp.]MDO9480657.1 alpha/beta fold hydrolase [Hydrogenophaga sp.]MDP3343186.1 alpha/beta fold hydrolase [Hydrogenophaga sp.]MDP3809246.1 alpha/beta fold hydrolase [Hydrogenophaga sp.]MDP3922540.1 alpha/beta fold hydrolase [Hydrogenophaga sp.]